MKSIREELKSLGITLESRYMIYTAEDRTLVIPYYHIRTLELKNDKVIIQTGSVEKIVIHLPSDTLANILFEELLLHIERIYLSLPLWQVLWI
ncbi:MAG: hypothetical protein ACK4LA_07175 [Aquificaceae bacterium]